MDENQTKKNIQLGMIVRDFDRGLSYADMAEKNQLSIEEVGEYVDAIKQARRQALHNNVIAMFLQGHTSKELSKYFGLTEREIRAIIEPSEKPEEPTEKTHEVFAMRLKQKGTDNTATIRVEAPLGMTFKEAYEAIIAGNNPDVKIVD